MSASKRISKELAVRAVFWFCIPGCFIPSSQSLSFLHISTQVGGFLLLILLDKIVGKVYLGYLQVEARSSAHQGWFTIGRVLLNSSSSNWGLPLWKRYIL
jgi:hypothetical protein